MYPVLEDLFGMLKQILERYFKFKIHHWKLDETCLDVLTSTYPDSSRVVGRKGVLHKAFSSLDSSRALLQACYLPCVRAYKPG